MKKSRKKLNKLRIRRAMEHQKKIPLKKRTKNHMTRNESLIKKKETHIEKKNLIEILMIDAIKMTKDEIYEKTEAEEVTEGKRKRTVREKKRKDLKGKMIETKTKDK